MPHLCQATGIRRTLQVLLKRLISVLLPCGQEVAPEENHEEPEGRKLQTLEFQVRFLLHLHEKVQADVENSSLISTC